MRYSLSLKIAATLLIVALIAPLASSLSPVVTKTGAQEANTVYPEQLLLQLINQGKINAPESVVDLLEEAAKVRDTNSTLADILVAQAFMEISNQTTHQCRGLYSAVIGLNITVTKLTQLVYRINNITKGAYNESLSQALQYLKEAEGNITAAATLLNQSRNNCTKTIAREAAQYLAKARMDIGKARGIIDSLTACKYKHVIMKALEEKLVRANMKIQRLAIKKHDLESKGFHRAAIGIERVEEKLAKENQVLLNTIKEINNTVNCTQLWATVASFKMLHSYEIMQGVVIQHFQHRAGMLEKSGLRFSMIAFKLNAAASIISDIENNTALPPSVKSNLEKISINIKEISELYREAIQEAWTGSPSLNQTEDKLLSLIDQTQDLIKSTENNLPKGFKQTQGLLKAVSRTLDMIKDMVQRDFQGISHIGREVRIAKQLTFRMQVKVLMRNTMLALTVADKYCNQTNSTVIQDLEKALDYMKQALNTENSTVAVGYLDLAAALVNNAQETSATECPQLQPVLIILEMEVNTTVTLLSS
jgi:hypothetical protein